MTPIASLSSLGTLTLAELAIVLAGLGIFMIGPLIYLGRRHAAAMVRATRGEEIEP